MSFSNFFQGNIIDPVSFMQVVRKQCSIYQNWNDSERMVLRIENIHSNIFLNAIRNFLSPVSVKTELDISELLGVAYTQIRNPDSNLSLLGRS